MTIVVVQADIAKARTCLEMWRETTSRKIDALEQQLRQAGVQLLKMEMKFDNSARLVASSSPLEAEWNQEGDKLDKLRNKFRELKFDLEHRVFVFHSDLEEFNKKLSLAEMMLETFSELELDNDTECRERKSNDQE